MSFYLNGYAYGNAPLDKKTVNITNPVTKEVIDTLPLAEDAQDAERILSIAEDGFDIWSKIPLYKRASILYRFVDRLEEHKEHIAEVMCRNMGRPITECRGELHVTIQLARGFIEKALHMYGEVLPDSQEGLENDIIFTKREPLGTIVCIIPFNAPVELYVHKVLPALIMGNSVIVKPPSSDPMSVLVLSDLMVETGVPSQAAQVMYCRGKFTSQFITRSPRIAAVTFTGSTAAGKAVYQDSAPELHRVFLELGGNDACIVMEDADLDFAANELVTTRLMNSGQVCCSSKRTLVPEHLTDTLAEKIKDRMALVKQGDPLDPQTELGSLVDSEAARTVKEQVDLTINQGAICVTGGILKDDVFMMPTLLKNVTADMDIAKNMEVFGPVISLISYQTIDEAIQIANQTDYGLQASIISNNTKNAVGVAEKLRAGAVVINGAGSYRHIDMAFGGYKHSGIGREGISSTLEEFSQVKSYVLKNIL